MAGLRRGFAERPQRDVAGISQQHRVKEGSSRKSRAVCIPKGLGQDRQTDRELIQGSREGVNLGRREWKGFGAKVRGCRPLKGTEASMQ